LAIDGPPGSHYNNVGSQSNSLSTVGIEGEAMMLRVTVFLLSLANVPIGQLPPDWLAARTGEGPGSVWKVVEDATAPGHKALAQTSAAGPNRLFNLCVANRTSFRDLDLSVAFRPIAGKLDQGGGLVWRYIDAKNYYVARMNPLEDNYRVYKVVAGKRTQLATAPLKIDASKWHTLRVVHVGKYIECYFDGKRYLDVNDETFPKAGKVGLWTKADAQTHFASFRAAEAPALHK
jgi:hypothetical protein